MGEYRSGSTAVTTIMLVSLVYTFLATLVLGSLAEASQYSRTIPMPGEVRAEMDALNILRRRPVRLLLLLQAHNLLIRWTWQPSRPCNLRTCCSWRSRGSCHCPWHHCWKIIIQISAPTFAHKSLPTLTSFKIFFFLKLAKN